MSTEVKPSDWDESDNRWEPTPGGGGGGGGCSYKVEYPYYTDGDSVTRLQDYYADVNIKFMGMTIVAGVYFVPDDVFAKICNARMPVQSLYAYDADGAMPGVYDVKTFWTNSNEGTQFHISEAEIPSSDPSYLGEYYNFASNYRGEAWILSMSYSQGGLPSGAEAIFPISAVLTGGDGDTNT